MQLKLREELILTGGKERKLQYLQSRSRELWYRIGDRVHETIRKIPLLRKSPNQSIGSGTAAAGADSQKRFQANDQNRQGNRNQGAHSRMTPGVAVAGLLDSEKGVGEAARATLRSLTAAEITYALNEIADPVSFTVENSSHRRWGESRHTINLIHVNADLLPRFARNNRWLLETCYNIGYWNWELSSFPQEWQDRFGYLDEVWVPSTFCHEAISRVSPIPVVRMPYSIDPAADGGRWTRTDFGLRPESFVFLFYFDAHSFVERKNPVGLIRAFRKAFSKSEDVYLLIKCSHGKRSMLRILNKACENHPNITIVDAILSRAALVALLSKCDTYVSLHRSEGFGLTLSEAMNLGKPVIATGYSSNLDFMNDSNSFLVKYKLVELKKRYGPYQEGFRWAEPDVSHAAELMREVYQDRERALMIGEQGRRDIRRLLHPKVIGSMMQSRLAEIAQITGLGRERSGASTAVSSARPGNR